MKYKYWGYKKQNKVRSKYQFWENKMRKLPSWWGYGGRYVGRTIDNWRYRNYIGKKRIRTYRVIGSRPKQVYGSRPQRKIGSNPRVVGSKPY